MQEAYRPWHIKYLLGGVPPSPLGYPPPGLTEGGTRGTPPSGVPTQPGLTGGTWGTPLGYLGYPHWGTPPVRVPPWQGTPLPDPMSGYPRYIPSQVLPLARSDWAGVPPWWVPPTWTWLGYPPPPEPGWGTPLGVDRQTDGQTRVKT